MGGPSKPQKGGESAVPSLSIDCINVDTYNFSESNFSLSSTNSITDASDFAWKRSIIIQLHLRDISEWQLYATIEQGMTSNVSTCNIAFLLLRSVFLGVLMFFAVHFGDPETHAHSYCCLMLPIYILQKLLQ